jgi:hypothetical protein
VFTPDGVCGGDGDGDGDDDNCPACQTDVDCADNDACTVDDCDTATGICSNTKVAKAADECCNPLAGLGSSEDVGGLGAVASNDDGNQCTDDMCILKDAAGDPIPGTKNSDRGIPWNPNKPAGTPCVDEFPCETVNDQCDGAGGCGGSFISTVPCNSDPECDLPDAAGATCDLVNKVCICELPQLEFAIVPSGNSNANCFAQAEKVVVDVRFRSVTVPATGGQFIVQYDPSCVTFNGAAGVDPYTFPIIDPIVDAANGRIFMAVGVAPGVPGVVGSATIARLSFIKLGSCTNCIFTFGGENPMNTYLVDNTGKPVNVLFKDSKEIHFNDQLRLDVPDSVKVNADCDTATAMVTWDAPTSSTSCEDPGCDPKKEKCYSASAECVGSHPGKDGVMGTADDENMTALAMGGGEHPQGVTTYTCLADSNICGSNLSKSWTVTVNDTTTLHVEVELSPVIAARNLTRCIEFELFSGCTTPPTCWRQDLVFGGLFDLIGQFSEEKKIPKGKWVCMTARDQLHSLASSSAVTCNADGTFSASFKGDPFFGGNWLIQGNLDAWQKDNDKASHNVIDILDFGTFLAQYGRSVNPNTPCTTSDCAPNEPGAHADINSDGVVDSLDFAFVLMNFLTSSKDACCPDGVAGAPVGLTEVSVRDLRQWQMGDLTVADLNGDGVINMEDMNAFLAGQVPVKKAPKRERSGSGISSRR